MVGSIGRKAVGTSPTGRGPIGRTMLERSRKNTIARVRQRMEQWRDRARESLLRARWRYKFKVKRNEALMQKRRLDREKNLNPSVVAFMPSKKFAKMLRDSPAKWSSVSAKPKYSRVKPRKRIYDKRWKLLEEGRTK